MGLGVILKALISVDNNDIKTLQKRALQTTIHNE
jgi:hypothetical protein